MKRPAIFLIFLLSLGGSPNLRGGDMGKGGKGPPSSDHWAFLAPRRPALPKVSRKDWARNPIDLFILARLEKEHLGPSPEADRPTLIRRLSLDLLGLPPTPAEVEAFVADRCPDAYERLVERLLASPHYGERWGRHWLDLARYADSNGFEKDRERPHAWRYRNWVIDTLNHDLPYDCFVIDQLAGDLLLKEEGGRRKEEKEKKNGSASSFILPPSSLDPIIATGFHRNTLTNEEDGVDREEFRVEQTIDRTNTTATVFLGLTLSCAQCHDHKYDPLTQRDYYRFFAFFNGLVEKDIPAPLAWEEGPYRKARAEYGRKQAELVGGLEDYLRTQLPANLRQWEKSLRPAEVRKLPPAVRAILAVPAGRRSPEQQKKLTAFYAPMDGTLEILQGLVDDHRRQEPKVSMAQVLVEGKGRPTHIFKRGDFLRPGPEVQPGIPEVLPPLTPAPPPRSAGGRPAALAGGPPALRGGGRKQATRLDLARWLVSPSNPLTGRVAVNRLWQHYFGQGLVRTPEDFGTRGARPTHPELLDWLAVEFRERGWSLKAMHRLIVCSATYRQSSVVREELFRRDPHNLLLARQARLRLEAEVIRDAALASSGLLYPVIGGPSVRPPQPEGVAEVTFLGTAHWEESRGLDRYRRGLYTFWRRTSPYPSFLTFDAPESNLTCTRRTRTNTPLQALVLLNDRVYVEAAQALARRVLREEPGGLEAQIRHAFRLCLARAPTSREVRRLAKLYAVQLRLCKADRRAAVQLAGQKPLPPGATVPETATWVAVSRVLMNLDEFITRE